MHVELRCLLSLLMSFLSGSVILQCVCADELEFLPLQFFKFPLCSCASKALLFFALVHSVADFSLLPLSFLSLSRVRFLAGSAWDADGRRSYFNVQRGGSTIQAQGA